MKIYEGTYYELRNIDIVEEETSSSFIDSKREYNIKFHFSKEDNGYIYYCYGRDRNKVFDVLNDIYIEDLKDKIAELKAQLKEAKDTAFQLALTNKGE